MVWAFLYLWGRILRQISSSPLPYTPHSYHQPPHGSHPSATSSTPGGVPSFYVFFHSSDTDHRTLKLNKSLTREEKYIFCLLVQSFWCTKRAKSSILGKSTLLNASFTYCNVLGFECISTNYSQLESSDCIETICEISIFAPRVRS